VATASTIIDPEASRIINALPEALRLPTQTTKTGTAGSTTTNVQDLADSVYKQFSANISAFQPTTADELALAG
jgi:hypothetical protein